MAAMVAQDRVRRLLQMRAECDLVRHRPGGYEERGLLAGEPGHVRLERGRARFVVDVVAHGREGRVRVHLLRGDYVTDMRWHFTRH